MKNVLLLIMAIAFLVAGCGTVEAKDSKIVHDAEYYILEAQNGEKWAKEDEALDKKLAYRGYCLILSPLYDKFEKVIKLDRKVQRNDQIYENWEWMRQEFAKMDEQTGKL